MPLCTPIRLHSFVAQQKRAVSDSVSGDETRADLILGHSASELGCLQLPVCLGAK